DHQAVAALEAEYAAAGSDVDVFDATRHERRCAVDVVAVVAVAAVDDDVAAVHQLGELVHDSARDRRRDHHPGRAGGFQLLDELGERGCADGTFALELRHGGGIDVVDDALVPVPHQPPDDVGAHPAESDHSKLHG